MSHSKIQMDTHKSLTTKIAIMWLGILLMGSFWLTSHVSTNEMNLFVMPKVPREGEPIVATLKLNNPTAEESLISYKLYADGELVKEGATIIQPASSKTYQYTYINPLLLGEQVNFMAKVASPQETYEQHVSLPPCPPQILSSFVSFASFSTSLMSSMSSMSYYQATFGGFDFNLGWLFTAVLVILLIFLELSQPVIREKTLTILKRLHIRFSVVSWILFIIFMGIFYSSVVFVIANI